jgi:tetratricopeptide (TPR) repeat protein
MLAARAHAGRRAAGGLAVALVLLLSLGRGEVTTASAQQPPRRVDRLQLVKLTMDALGPPHPPGAASFQVVVNYQLQTAQSGFLLLFLFEDDSRNSTQDSAQGHRVAAGTGRVTMDGIYQPGSGARTLTVLVGLFKDDETLLAWTSTNPVSLDPLPGRTAFAHAMAARLAGDHAQAVKYLTAAIQLAPQAGNYYYWRAASQIRLGQYDGAILDYTRALELMPQDRASRVGRGVALLWKEAWEPAIADLTRVIEESATPDQPAAWASRARGIAYAALNQPAQAIADYESYLSLAPQAPDRAEVEGWIAELHAAG